MIQKYCKIVYASKFSGGVCAFPTVRFILLRYTVTPTAIVRKLKLIITITSESSSGSVRGAVGKNELEFGLESLELDELELLFELLLGSLLGVPLFGGDTIKLNTIEEKTIPVNVSASIIIWYVPN